MRVEVHEPSGSPVPQFVVYAENETERLLLQLIMRVVREQKLVMRVGGYTFHTGQYGSSGVSAFNFGFHEQEPRFT